jgi:hypothetical protein
MKALLRIAALAAACAGCGAALACGTCAEDKIAATYDHATVQRAVPPGVRVSIVRVDAPARH